MSDYFSNYNTDVVEPTQWVDGVLKFNRSFENVQEIEQFVRDQIQTCDFALAYANITKGIQTYTPWSVYTELPGPSQIDKINMLMFNVAKDAATKPAEPEPAPKEKVIETAGDLLEYIKVIPDETEITSLKLAFAEGQDDIKTTVGLLKAMLSMAPPHMKLKPGFVITLAGAYSMALVDKGQLLVPSKE